ncbi:MAG: hypothetical protein LBT62_02895 [Deltaproteobacteria bacterium]|jgi:hypothetical protein|nr:hypothetical protein [Deltaproteobacteria bacterium]
MYVDFKGRSIETPLGLLKGAGEVEFHVNGALKSVRLLERNTVITPSGPLAPAYTWGEIRRKHSSSITFFLNGAIKSLRLEQRTLIHQPRPMVVERIAWYPQGQVKMLFPLDGRLSAYWTQKEEMSLAEPLDVALPDGSVLNKIHLISIGFHQNQALKSLTLWPGQRVQVATAYGTISARLGLDFYPDGSPKSLEPAKPTAVLTPLGSFMAYDPMAIGLNGENGSLAFAADQSLLSLKTLDEFTWENAGNSGQTEIFRPLTLPHPLNENAVERFPNKLEFIEQGVRIGFDVPGKKDRFFELPGGPVKIGATGGSKVARPVRGIVLPQRSVE